MLRQRSSLEDNLLIVGATKTNTVRRVAGGGDTATCKAEGLVWHRMLPALNRVRDALQAVFSNPPISVKDRSLHFVSASE